VLVSGSSQPEARELTDAAPRCARVRLDDELQLMAGGLHAAIVPCLYCAARAERTHEGIEDDHYECSACGRRFGICFDDGVPTTPSWPITVDQTAAIRKAGQVLLACKAELRPPAQLVRLCLVNERFVPPMAYPLAEGQKQWTIGRYPDCDVQILSRSLAPKHTVVTLGPGYLTFRDVASGTETPVRVGDEITLADVTLRLTPAAGPTE
jgi:hypothetical protein